MTEYLAIVDENDAVIGKASWDEIRKNNLLHRGTCVLVFNSKKELFVHQRSFTLKRYAGLYALFVGGGVEFSETYDENAVRELEEETGIKDVKLHFLFKITYTATDIKSIIQVYSCRYDGPLSLQKEEIEQGFFVSLKELQSMQKTKEFSPINAYVFKEYLKKYHKNDPAITDI